MEAVRSYSAHVMAMVGFYAKSLVPPAAVRPMVFYTANQQGSGKSTLAQMVFSPVLGTVAAEAMPHDEDNFQKVLDSAAQAFAPAVFLDDLGNFVKSNRLNSFITAPRHAGRVLGAKDRFDVPNVTQVFATANNVSGTADLARRAVIVELFYAGELRERKFDRFVTAPSLARQDVRADFLSALCAIVRNFAERKTEMAGALEGIAPLATFEDWSRTMAGIVMLAGFCNPLTPPLCAFDEEGDEIKDLLLAAAAESELDVVFDREGLAEVARKHGLIEELVGRGEREMDSKQTKRFGLRLKGWLGREMVDARGRRFRFGKARQRKGASYPLTFLDAAAA